MRHGLKHAIIVLAHKDTSQLSRLVNSLDENFTFFIHIDSNISKEEADSLRRTAKDNVFYYNWGHVTWGGIRIVKTQLKLMKEALLTGDFDYFHLLSGQDYPVASCKDIDAWFEKHNGKQFIEHYRLPFDKWENGTFQRLQFYRLHDWIDYSSKRGRGIIDKVTSFQIRHKIYRRIPDQYPRLFGGSNWMSITGDCAKMLVNLDNLAKSFLRRLRFTFASDEIFFHTIIMNSKFADSVVNDNKRYIRWSNGIVKPLGKNDLWDIAVSDALFARKFISDYSEPLLQSLPLVISPSAKANYSHELGKKIITFAKLLNISRIFDFNSGAGLYVRQFHVSGIKAFGLTNCHDNALLSAYVFPNGFKCQCIDLTGIVEIEKHADLTMSVLSGLDYQLINNKNFVLSLIKNSSRYVLIAYKHNDSDDVVKLSQNSRLETLFNSIGFHIDKFASAWFSRCDFGESLVEVIVYGKI